MREVLKESEQELYSGIKKVRELRHDTALYEVYQAKAQEIEEAGGKIKRVVLDYELKRKLNRDLNKVKDNAPSDDARLKEEIGRKHAVPLFKGSSLCQTFASSTKTAMETIAVSTWST